MSSIKKAVCAFFALLIVCLSPITLAAFDDEGVDTRHIILMEANSQTVLYEKEAYAQAFPASTTKIMTCILALEQGDIDEMVTVPGVTERGSCIRIRKGEKLSLRSLLYGMMLASGNDAAEAIAVHIGGTKADFVAMMNEKARELGMTGTHFMEPSGLHKEEHYTTAYDFALLTRYALLTSPRKDDFRAIVKRGDYTIRDSSRTTYELINSNKLIHTKVNPDGTKEKSFEYRDAIGVKTGDTDYAQRCLVAAAERGGVLLVTVQLYDKAADYRFELAAKLFDWGFENFASTDASSLGFINTLDVPVSNASFEDEINQLGGMLTLNIDLAGKTISRTKDEIDNIRGNAAGIVPEIVSDTGIVAPIEQGEVVATVAYKFNGEVLFTAKATASKSVAAMGAASQTLDPPDIKGIENNKKAGPWLFIILVLVAIFFVVGLIIYARNRKRRRRGRRRSRARRERR
ncbi:MAG: D-alanyl-D-alanine carboxypeptidase [Clostridiales bacterium]|nr:D-alanyl-D-alanine carboxypeptidase [Clostridiales bacterium]